MPYKLLCFFFAVRLNNICWTELSETTRRVWQNWARTGLKCQFIPRIFNSFSLYFNIVVNYTTLSPFILCNICIDIDYCGRRWKVAGKSQEWRVEEEFQMRQKMIERYSSIFCLIVGGYKILLLKSQKSAGVQLEKS